MSDDSHNQQGPGSGPGAPPPAGPGGFRPPLGQGYGPPPPRPEWYPPPPRRGSVFSHPAAIIVLFFGICLALVIILAGVAARPASRASTSSWGFDKKVGVIEIEGIIFESRAIIESIHRYRDDNSIKAVVLRVDSPGGAVGASQEIHDEVRKLAAKKPVVVSMGNVAASGGYYISCPARKIFANPGTITGSIGVVMELTNLEELFAWMKIKNEVIKSGRLKDIGSPYREMTAEEKQILQDFVDQSHRQFEKAVADGRKEKLSPEEVHAIANGNIYTGERALELGLIDEIGNLWAAIDAAAKLGGIKGDPSVQWPVKKAPNLFLDAFGSLFPGFDLAEDFVSPVRVMYILKVQ